jgi:hypothetical protein
MYRRDDALAAGGYDETMAGFQDWDLWLKLGLRGRLANFPEYLLYYQIWPGSGSLLQSRQNVASARTIVRRYRRRYRHFPLAYTMAMLYSAYAQLPLPARRASYAFLSRMKKATFAANASPSPNREL